MRSLVLVAALLAGCVTVQTNIAFEEGSGSTRVRAAKQDVGKVDSNVTTTNLEVPVSLVPK